MGKRVTWAYLERSSKNAKEMRSLFFNSNDKEQSPESTKRAMIAIMKKKKAIK